MRLGRLSTEKDENAEMEKKLARAKDLGFVPSPDGAAEKDMEEKAVKA